MTKGDDALAIYDDDQPCAAPAPSASTGVHVRAVRRDGGEGESQPRLHDRGGVGAGRGEVTSPDGALNFG